MIGVDTNVLLRFMLRDDALQSPRAEFLMRRCSASDRAVVSAVTLAEFIWVLRRRRKVTKERLIAVVEDLLALEQLCIPDALAMKNALRKYRSGTADLPDYFIAELNAAQGGRPTYTFDKDAAKDDSFTMVPG